jgi:lipopolysaccharide biosynthesis glycosyltransferase
MSDDAAAPPRLRATVVLAGDAGFAWPLAVAISSLTRHTPPYAELLVIDLGLSSADHERLARAAGAWPLRIVGVQPEWFDGMPRNRLPVGTYARLFATQLVADDCERILYLDGDTLVRVSVEPLLEVDLHGHPVGAVRDRLATHFAHPRASANMPGWQRAGIPSSAMVFNSGVLVIDRAAWDEASATKRVVESARTLDGETRWADQAFLNLALWREWLPLAAHWNSRRDDAFVAHFAGPYKPWGPPALATRLYADYADAAAQIGWSLPGRRRLRARAAAHRVARAALPPKVRAARRRSGPPPSSGPA